MFRTQLRHELLKLFARKRTYIGFGAFLFVQVTILLLLQLPKAKQALRHLLEVNGYVFEKYDGGLTLGMLIILFTVGLLGALYLALVAGDMVAKEIEEGTLRMILSRPVSRVRILVLKAIACALYTFVLILFIGATSLLAGVIYRGELGHLFLMAPQERIFAMFDPREGLWRFARGVVFLGLSLQVITSLGLMLSCFKMKPAAATIVTLSVLFVDLVLRNVPYFASFEHWFITYHTACWIRTFQDVVPWWSILQSLIYLLALNLSFLVVGAMSFCARDFKT